MASVVFWRNSSVVARVLLFRGKEDLSEFKSTPKKPVQGLWLLRDDRSRQSDRAEPPSNTVRQPIDVVGPIPVDTGTDSRPGSARSDAVGTKARSTFGRRQPKPKPRLWNLLSLYIPAQSVFSVSNDCVPIEKWKPLSLSVKSPMNGAIGW